MSEVWDSSFEKRPVSEVIRKINTMWKLLYIFLGIACGAILARMMFFDDILVRLFAITFIAAFVPFWDAIGREVFRK